MKTSQLLELDENKLVPLLRSMKIKELEKHARKLLKQQGGDDFNAAMKQVVGTLQQDHLDAAERFQKIKMSLQEMLKSRSLQSDNGFPHQHLVDRTAMVVSLYIIQRFKSHYNDTLDA